MKKRAKKTKNKKDQNQPVLPLREFVGAFLFESVISLGMEQIYGIFETERERLCGPRYLNNGDRAAYRAGHAPTTLAMGGRMVELSRPRVRSRDGKRELPLESFEQFRRSDPLTPRMMEQMLVGVSTRKYERSLESLPEGMKGHGTSKSSVSRQFIKGTEKKMREFLNRDLSPVNPIIIMIDGVHISEHVLLVALGVDVTGKKTVLGIQEGATENSVACKQLLRDIVSRGISQERSILFVLDGSKALRKGVKALWGGLGFIQRCQEHKCRNVEAMLPKYMQHSVRQAMKQAYKRANSKSAKRLLMNLADRLKQDHPGAAGSLKEGLDETLTVLDYGIDGKLLQFLSTTNAIENLIGTVRTISRRVKRWRSGAMVIRWTSCGLLEAERGFRRITGYRQLPKVAAVLRANDRKRGVGERQFDNMKKPA